MKNWEKKACHQLGSRFFYHNFKLGSSCVWMASFFWHKWKNLLRREGNNKSQPTTPAQEESVTRLDDFKGDMCVESFGSLDEHVKQALWVTSSMFVEQALWATSSMWVTTTFVACITGFVLSFCTLLDARSKY
jgi:hypothetical protein